MKILFLAGSFEPGKDGVGDYTITLAAECARRGHETLLLSLNDPWINAPIQEHSRVRLGAEMHWAHRATIAQKFVNEGRPDLVSLQFVPYSFDPAGLNLRLPQILRKIIGKTPVQTMFHELWIGSQTNAPLKSRMLGLCQLKLIQAVLKRLNSRVIHTSNLIYVQLLARCGIEAKHLPLCGSVPLTAVDPLPAQRTEEMHLGMFGSIHPEWSPDRMLDQLGTLGRPIRLSHIGRIGPGNSVWQQVIERHGCKIVFQRLGEQSLENVSRYLSSLDFGVSSTPLSLIGKSSCVAAMLDHGLPVIVPRNDVHFRGIPGPGESSGRLIPVDDRFLPRIQKVRRQDPRPWLPGMAARFLADLGAPAFGGRPAPGSEWTL